MNSTPLLVLALVFFTGISVAAGTEKNVGKTAIYVGSASCRDCHEKFYQLWSNSRHGLAMQPYSPAFAKAQLTPHKNSIRSNSFSYQADTREGVVVESGPHGSKTYPIAHVLGGKNVFYFLTTLAKGRLQTLPIAYDVRKKEWFDTARSGLRHIPGQGSGAVVGWQEWPYTFNTACHSCHVSQLSPNYNQKNDSYTTTWTEPGINCETCHGPSGEHNQAMRQLPKGWKPANDAALKLVRTKSFTPAQHNDACNSCHAKSVPLTSSYRTPERFFDHFDLVTLENPDFYPDGRDLGENYTQTSWLMSPCAKEGKLHCVSCHTSSGRYRFKKPEDANKACLPCHAERVQNVAAHSHHPAGSSGSLCVSCHMPTTGFARMQRTDHSMRPPTPATTITYQSPNACNSCHTERDAAWADRLVRQWHTGDYQASVLRRASMLDAARKRDWTDLSSMVSYISDPGHNEIFATSLIRLLVACEDPAKKPALRKAMTDRSPLVRSAAVEALGQYPDKEILSELVAATGDEYRLVRVRAAAALAQFPKMVSAGTLKEQVDKATDEYLTFVMARPDQWASHYNAGNYRLGRGENSAAIASYLDALHKEPKAVMAWVNVAIAYARTGEHDKAEQALLQALEIAPDHAAVHLNLGLLKAELHQQRQAVEHLKKALQLDSGMAQAAYNLCILTAQYRMEEAIGWCRQAVLLSPYHSGYGYTLAFFLTQKGDTDEAITTLQTVLRKHPGYRDAELLLGELTKKQKNSFKQ